MAARFADANREKHLGGQRERHEIIIRKPKDRFEDMGRQGGRIEKLSDRLGGEIYLSDFFADDADGLAFADRDLDDVARRKGSF